MPRASTGIENHGGDVNTPREPGLEQVDSRRWLVAGKRTGRPSKRRIRRPRGSTPPTTYESLPGRFGLLHTVDARVGNQSVEGAEIIGLVPSRGCYVTQYVGSDGPNSYEASLTDVDGVLVWTMRSAAIGSLAVRQRWKHVYRPLRAAGRREELATVDGGHADSGTGMTPLRSLDGTASGTPTGASGRAPSLELEDGGGRQWSRNLQRRAPSDSRPRNEPRCGSAPAS